MNRIGTRNAFFFLMVFAVLTTGDAIAQRDVNLPLGLEGFCPVAIHESNEWRQGNALFSAWYDGILYRFENFDNREKFLENPGKYVPAYGGLCTVCMVDNSIQKYGSVMETVRYEDRLYLFPRTTPGVESVKSRFLADKTRYTSIGVGNNGQCIVSFVDSEGQEVVPGNSEFVEFHKHKMYYFQSRDHQLKFRRDPSHYVQH